LGSPKGALASRWRSSQVVRRRPPRRVSYRRGGQGRAV